MVAMCFWCKIPHILHVYFVIEDHYLFYSCLDACNDWLSEEEWQRINMTCSINGADDDIRHRTSNANVRLLTMCHKNWLFIKFMAGLAFSTGDTEYEREWYAYSSATMMQWWTTLRAKFPWNRQISNNINVSIGLPIFLLLSVVSSLFAILLMLFMLLLFLFLFTPWLFSHFPKASNLH